MSPMIIDEDGNKEIRLIQIIGYAYRGVDNLFGLDAEGRIWGKIVYSGKDTPWMRVDMKIEDDKDETDKG